MIGTGVVKSCRLIPIHVLRSRSVAGKIGGTVSVRSFSIGDVWNQMKEKVKTVVNPNPEPPELRQTRNDINQAIDDTSKALPGVAGFIFRRIAKMFTNKVLKESAEVYTILLDIKGKVENQLNGDPEVRRYFGRQISILEDMPQFQMGDFTGSGKEQFKMTATIRGSKGELGHCFLGGTYDRKKKTVQFSEVRVVDDSNQLISSQVWDTAGGTNLHYNTNKVISVTAHEVKEK
jgi:hypothetical protein